MLSEDVVTSTIHYSTQDSYFSTINYLIKSFFIRIKLFRIFRFFRVLILIIFINFKIVLSYFIFNLFQLLLLVLLKSIYLHSLVRAVVDRVHCYIACSAALASWAVLAAVAVEDQVAGPLVHVPIALLRCQAHRPCLTPKRLH